MSYDELKAELDTGWPPPLDAVQNFFEDMWNYVAEVGQDIVNSIMDLAADFFERIYDAIFTWFYQLFGSAYYEAYNHLYKFPSPARQVLALMITPLLWTKSMIIDNLTAAIVHVYDYFPGWLRDFFEGAKTFVDNVRTAAQEFFKDPVAALQDGFNGVVTSVVKAFHDIFDPIADSFKAGFETLKESINDLLKPITDTLDNIKTWLNETAKGFIDSVTKWINDFSSNVTKAITDGFSGFVAWLKANPSHVLEVMNPTFMAFMETLKKAAPDLAKNIEDSFSGGFGWLLHNLKEGFKSISKWADENIIKPLFDGLKWLVDKLVLQVKGFFIAIANGLRGIKDKIMAGNVADAFTAMLPYVTGIGLAFLLVDVASIKVMGSGVDLTAVKEFFKDIFDPKMFSSIFMGVLTAKAVEIPLGYWANKTFRPMIPPVNDLITFYKLSLLDKERLKDMLTYHGYSDEFTDWYEYSAWELPRFQDVFTAYLRGRIDEAEYNRWLDILNIKREPRPGFTTPDKAVFEESFYRLPSMFMMVYAVETGVMGIPLIKQMLKESGIHPKYIDVMANALYHRALRGDIEDIKNMLVAQYAKGRITKDQLIAEAEALKMLPEQQQILIKRAEAQYTDTLAKDYLDYYKELLRRGKITKKQFVNELTAMGWDPDRLRAIADLVVVKSSKLDIIDLTKDERTSIRTTLVKMFKEGLMTEDEMRSKLTELGFSPAEIDLTVERAKLEYRYDYYYDLKKAILEAYYKGIITRDDAMNALVGIGLQPERAEAIIAYEEYKKAPKAKPPG